MNALLHQNIESKSLKAKLYRFKRYGLMNSKYKSAFRASLKRAKRKSVYATKKRLKSFRAFKASKTAMIIKVLIFAIALIFILVGLL
jgi:hypothetical protein